MEKDRIIGIVKQAEGALQTKAGELLGDAKLVADGKLKQAEGKLQNAAGSIKDELKKA